MSMRICKKSFEKSSKYNLQDDDEEDEEQQLTHFGQSLSEIEKFDAPRADSDDEDTGHIGADIVGEQHFGGFFTEKDPSKSEGEYKTWKEKMEELITKTRKERYEKQHEREITTEMTKKLNAEWKENGIELALAMLKMTKEEKKAPNKDDFDMTVRELHYDLKAQPTDRLKSEEELAKEAKEKLEQLEADRLRRMKGLPDEKETTKQKHVSADDLDDGFTFEKVEKKGVVFKDGKMVVDGESSESEAGDSEDGEESMKGSDEENDEVAEEGSEEDEDAQEDEEEDDDEEEEDTEDSGSDLASSEDEEDQEEEKSAAKPTKIETTHKSQIEKAKQELPYTFKAPETYEELLQMFEGHTDDEVIKIIERTRKCHHPSLAEGNKTKLQGIMTLLFQFYCDLALQVPPKTKLMNDLVIHLYELSQQFPKDSADAVRALIFSRYDDLSEEIERRNGRAAMPGLDSLLLLKLIPLLFPASDFRHPVTTPAMLYMSQVLSKCQVKSIQDIFCGLFVCNIFLEYVILSKRYVPEAMNFLRGVLFLACDPKLGTSGDHPVLPPFKAVGKTCGLLLTTSKVKKATVIKTLSISEIFSPQNKASLETDQHRLSCLKLCFKLVAKFANIYKELPSFTPIFEPLLYFCRQIDLKNHPQSLKDELQEFINIYEIPNEPLQCLARKKQKPVISRTYEPKLEENFDGKKKRGGSKRTQEEQKIQYQYKREMKGAIRDVRKDSQFLAKHRLDEQMQRDNERKQKMKRLMSDLKQQEGEVRALERKKHRPETNA